MYITTTLKGVQRKRPNLTTLETSVLTRYFEARDTTNKQRGKARMNAIMLNSAQRYYGF